MVTAQGTDELAHLAALALGILSAHLIARLMLHGLISSTRHYWPLDSDRTTPLLPRDNIRCSGVAEVLYICIWTEGVCSHRLSNICRYYSKNLVCRRALSSVRRNIPCIHYQWKKFFRNMGCSITSIQVILCRRGYVVIRPAETWTSASSRLEACVTEIGEWKSGNLLKLNQEKTEFMMFWPLHRPLSPQNYVINIGQSKFTPASM